MKWILFSFTFLYFSGCAFFEERSASYLVYGHDFTSFVEKGFYFSPHMYNGKYITMGTLDILYLPEVRVITYDEFYSPPPPGWWFIIKGGKYLKVKDVYNKELLDKMYEEALKLNGNGVMNFRMVSETDPENPWLLTARFYGTVIKIVD